MPRCAYIFLKCCLITCDIFLICSITVLTFFQKFIDPYEQMWLTSYAAETPAGILILTIVGLVFFIDRS